MVARYPPNRNRVAPLPLDPALLRETVKKVERCMERLQVLQCTVTGGKKVVSGVSLSPRSTRGYMKTSLRCKQESLRRSNGVQRISPPGKFPGGLTGGDWKRMSLPAMLVGETIGEIIQASQFAREIVQAVTNLTQAGPDDPKTPVTNPRKHRPEGLESSQLRSRRKREKQNVSQSFRLETGTPKLKRARSRINFKVSPPKITEMEAEKNNSIHVANRVSPRNKPWAKKTVLFPNPLFTSTSPTRQQPMKFCRTRSPIIGRNKQPPHLFLIKSPESASSKVQGKSKKSPPKSSSPTRTVALTKRSPPRRISPTRAAVVTSLTQRSPGKSISPKRSLTKRSPPRRMSPARVVTLTKKSPPKRVSPPRAVALPKKSPKLPTVSKWARSRSPARLACCIKTISPPRGVTIPKKSPKMSTASKLRRSLSPARLANRLMSPLRSRKPEQRSSDGLIPIPNQRPTTPMRFLIRGI